MSYAQARKDCEFLENMVLVEDTVGLMSELDRFMRNPTKDFAQDLYENKIGLWFDERAFTDKCFLFDKKVISIAKKYNIKLRYE